MTPEEQSALEGFIAQLEEGLQDGEYYWFEIGPEQSAKLLVLLKLLRDSRGVEGA
jgi:hypothetical protein